MTCSLRVFFAVLLPSEVKSQIADHIRYLEKRVSGIRPEKEEKIHITLKFIRSVENCMISDLRSILYDASRKFNTFSLKITKLSVLPSFRVPRVVALSIGQSKELCLLHNFIQTNIEKIGINKDNRDFLPHVTIGRVKNNFTISRELSSVQKIDFNVKKIALMRSKLTNEGSIYSALKVYKLGDGLD